MTDIPLSPSMCLDVDVELELDKRKKEKRMRRLKRKEKGRREKDHFFPQKFSFSGKTAILSLNDLSPFFHSPCRF